VVLLAVVLGHTLARLAREIRIAAVVWRALRDTRPNERPEILQTLANVSTRATTIPAIPEVNPIGDMTVSHDSCACPGRPRHDRQHGGCDHLQAPLAQANHV
jgi:hypothetical protein